MTLNVTLPHGKSIDLAAATVIRTVGEAESRAYNERLTQDLARRPDFNGVVPSRRWTVAIELANGEGRVTTRYTSDISVAGLVEAAPEIAQRFELVDGGRAALARGARVHLIRPLIEREGSDNKSVIYVEGGSSSGLYVSQAAPEIHRALGARAQHLTAIGEEGFIDRSRIESVAAFDPSRELAPGQQRFAIAVRLKGVWRPQYFTADEAMLRGEPVIDLRKEAARPAGGGKGHRVRASSAPEVR